MSGLYYFEIKFGINSQTCTYLFIKIKKGHLMTNNINNTNSTKTNEEPNQPTSKDSKVDVKKNIIAGFISGISKFFTFKLLEVIFDHQ